MTTFLEDFDSLFNAILTDYQNQDPGVDVSQGSLVYMKSACLASALWGIYKYQDYIANQIFPDTSSSASLDHHGYVYGISRKYGESDAAYLARILSRIQQPPSGGNQNDYVQWALSIQNVAGAWCFPLGQGVGTVDVVITADAAITGSEIPSSHADTGTATALSTGNLMDAAANFQSATPVAIGDIVNNSATGAQATVTVVTSGTELALSADIFTAVGQAYTITSLCAQVLNYINSVKPVGTVASATRVLPPTLLNQDVAMTTTGANVNNAQIEADIEAYMQTFIPGQTLYLSQLTGIARDDGAQDSAITEPATAVTPAAYQMIRPGTITVTPA